MSRVDALRRRALSVLPPRPSDDVWLTAAAGAFRMALPAEVRRRLAAALRSGVSREETAWWLFRSDERVACIVADLADYDDWGFLYAIFLDAFDRAIDDQGAAHYLAELRAGRGREDVAAAILRSGESETLARIAIGGLAQLPDLVSQRPDRYEELARAETPWPRRLFHRHGPADVDWLEQQILRSGYYELPNHWTSEVDDDKRTMAELLAAFSPARGLELGCSTGAVLQCLLDRGVVAEGVDLAEAAKAHALPAVRAAITVGDILDAPLDGGRDLIWGLDVFEHLNPNRLRSYLDRLAGLLAPGGMIVANIPAYGPDPMFGVGYGHTELLDEWRGAEGLFDRFPADALGFPALGHLAWATCRWWTEQFAAAGLVRAPSVEAAIQRRYGRWFEAVQRARRTMFVFAAAPEPLAAARVVAALGRDS